MENKQIKNVKNNFIFYFLKAENDVVKEVVLTKIDL